MYLSDEKVYTRDTQRLGAWKIGLFDIPHLLCRQGLTRDQIIECFQVLGRGPSFLGFAENPYDAITSAGHDVAIGHCAH